MDKTRDARRSTTTTMAALNGVTKRRHRISENSRVQRHHVSVAVTVRDRPEKKFRDPESLDRSMRKRSKRFASRNEDSSDESLGDDEVQHNFRRKSFPSSRIPRHASAAAASLKVADEMIGVAIPRKARSACMKRSHDCRTSSGSGGVGFGEDRRRPPASPGSYSFEVASPSSSTVSVKHHKNVSGSKSRIPKPPKSPGTIEDDLEIEIAEVLSGLKKKQPHSSSKREDDSENSLKSSEVIAMKKLKTDGDDSSTGAENGGLISCKARHSANIDQSTENPEKPVRLIPETHRTNNGTETTEASSLVSDIQKEKEVRQEQRLDSQNSSGSKGVSEGQNNRDESNCSSKIEIDLMVPQTMPSSPGRVSLFPLASDYCKQDCSVKNKDEIIVKNETTAEEVKQNNAEKREWLNLDLERPSKETTRDFDWNQPFPVAVSAWPGGLPPHGYVPPLIQTGKPVDENKESSTLKLMQQGAPFSTSQPKRCATHLFIARNIQLHQQHFIKTNHLSQPTNKAFHLKTGDNLIPAAKSPSSFPTLSLNSQAHDRISAVNSGPFALTREKKPQPPPPPGSISIVPAQTLIFPTNHHLQQKSPSPRVGSATVNFSHPNSLSPNEAPPSTPYFTIIPNNAYTLQRGGSTPSQGMQFFNGSFYSPPQQMMFQQPPPQLLQKQSQSSQRLPPQPQSQANVNNNQKHRQQQQQPSQKSEIMMQNFSMSFASHSPPANLSFSSSNGGYHIVSAAPPQSQPSVIHQKCRESRTGGGGRSSGEDQPKKTLVFDNPSRTLNFVSGTWPPPATINDPSVRQQYQQYSRSKTTTHHDSVPAATSSSSSSSQWKNHPATASSSSSLNLSNKQFQSQQQQQIIRTQHRQTQISFAAPPQGMCSSSSDTKAANSKVNNNKALPLSPVPSSAAQLQDHQTDNSTSKTSPVCGRTVPPIITSCPSHLSEAKVLSFH